MTKTNQTSADPPATNPAEINEDTLDNVVGGQASSYIGETEKIRQRLGDGSVKPVANKFNSTAGGSPNI